MSDLHHAQILLESEQHQALTTLAIEQGTSLSALVRDIVRQYLMDVTEQAQEQRRLKAIENLSKLRHSIRSEHGVLASDFLEDARDERMQDHDDVLKGEL